MGDAAKCNLIMQYLLKKYMRQLLAAFSLQYLIAFDLFSLQGSGRRSFVHTKVAFDLFSEWHSASLVTFCVVILVAIWSNNPFFLVFLAYESVPMI